MLDTTPETTIDYTTKWCPFSRVIFAPRDADGKAGAVANYNRSADSQPLANCIGEGCAIWDRDHNKPGCR